MSHILGSAEDLASKDLDSLDYVACTKEAFTDADEVFRLIGEVSDADSVRAELQLTQFTKLLSQYQLQPHLLDSHLEKILHRLIGIVKDGQTSVDLKHEAFKYLVVVSHVRGYKTVARMLPHEVSDLEPVLRMLMEQDAGNVNTWATRHMLLLWLSIIVMMPFHMSKLDSFTASEANGRKTTMEKILDVCKQYLSVLDSCHRPAAFLTSRFLTRSDVIKPHLGIFFDWANKLEGNPPAGVMAAVCWIFKHGKRDDLLPFATPMLRWAQKCTKGDQMFSLTHKFAMKLIQRIGLTYLKPRIAPWRYQRGSRSLADNLKTVASVESSSESTAEPEDEDFEVPDELEEVVEELIQGLRHTDLVVRWSAAKGLGRITVRLPKELGDEVVASVLAVMNAREVPHAWHGGCLALAELGRRGLLLPSRLPEVVPIVLKALAFDEKRANLPVGAVIRDSACYVCWAFARAFDKDVLEPYINSIASALVVVTVFDREINCRRAASAAFQENVGRQGTFPHGLEIITTADFFSVGIRHNAFLEISVQIAQFEEYTLPLIDHLLQKKVDHWDISIRELAAKALHKLTPLAPEYMAKIVLPELLRLTSSIDLHTRHGSITAVGEVLAGFSKCPQEKEMMKLLDDATLTETRDLVTQIGKRHQFQGMGGDLMRQAVLSFIKNASIAKMPFHEHTQTLEDWQKVMIDSMKQVDPQTRTRSVEALPAFCEHFCKDLEGKILPRQSTLITILLEALSNIQAETTRMGFCKAVGALPRFMFEGVSASVIHTLAKCSEITAETTKWTESRRDALLALSAVCATTGTTPSAQGDESWWYPNQSAIVFHRFIDGLNDYTRDSRGDVGAWVREASMSGLQSTVQLALISKPCVLTEELMTTVVGMVSRNAVERIDRTRKHAGKVFSNLLYSHPTNNKIPCLESLLQIFTLEICREINWSAEVQTFPLFTRMLALPPYTSHILMGLVASVGGLTESLVKHSSSALFEYLGQQSREELARISKCILNIFEEHQGQNRITEPLMRFLDRLFCSRVLVEQDGTLPADFAINLVKLVSKETARCSSVPKYLAAIPVLCQVAAIRAEKKASDTALSYLAIYLCHNYPRVRGFTAEQMYEAIMVAQDDGFSDLSPEVVLGLLSETDWTYGKISDLQPIRNDICDKLQIPKPKRVQKKTT
ncbi:tubulin-specific chaperone D [Cloeon dipterum]|uniref:tubulin-specific chaperone D n=1 Tax=Cloeon dipterum TaxID=197152 RepID=UPI00321FA9F3